jgi:anaerobic magnesium-protoporphyrin IX monomethyl ester cyclase
MKRILFIILPYIINHTRYAQRSFLTTPYGVLSIATYIKDIADVEIFDCNLYDGNIDINNILAVKISAFNPDIIGISMMFDNSYKYLKHITELCKLYSHAKILLGGAATTFSYKEILEQNPDIDAVCYGEGELSVNDYILTGIFQKGWATKKNLLPQKYYADNLDLLIDIDYSFIDVDHYQRFIEEAYSPYSFGREGKRQFFIVTSRGCAFSCLFCMNSNNPDKFIRYASVNAIIDHVENLIAKYGMNVLTFYDDQILYDMDRAKELFRRLAIYNLRIEMPNGVSPAFIDEELAELMHKAGVDSLYLALESGSKDVLKMMHKPVNLNQVRELMPILRRYNFFIFIFIVIGIPGETDAHRQETMDFLYEIKPDIINPKVASPVYGSKLRDKCIEKGYIADTNTKIGEYDMTEAVINCPPYSPEYLKKECLRMMYEINYIRNYRMEIKDYAVAKHYAEYVLSKYPNEKHAQVMLKRVNEITT